MKLLPAIAAELAEWSSGHQYRVPTGYASLDDAMNGGIALGELALVLARSGVGKSYLATNIVARNEATPTVVFSLEMHARYFLSRLTAIAEDTPTWDIEEELRRNGRSPLVERTVGYYPLLAIEDDPSSSIDDMHNSIETHEPRPNLVIVDYLGLVRSFGNTKSEATDQVAQELKNLARDTNTAVVALHQVSRGESRHEKNRSGRSEPVKNEGQWPLSMSDGAYGGEYAADYVVGLYRPSLHPKMGEGDRRAEEHKVFIQLLKNRSGPQLQRDGVLHFWDARTGRIEEYTRP